MVVVGASAGGIEVLQGLVRGLPQDFPGSVFIVVHIPSWRKSALPEVLSSKGRLPAIHPRLGQAIEPGRVYVAPPDHHLLLDHGTVLLSRGPKVNRHRPAIDPLFRSAAEAYGERVVGVIASGSLDDGAAGLWWIKHHGGLAVVQSPEEAAFPQMPCSALERVTVDYVVRTSEMSELLTKLTNGHVPLAQSPPYGLPAEELAKCKPKT
jgi:two-component system chemotaxis response regulator CheB